MDLIKKTISANVLNYENSKSELEIDYLNCEEYQYLKKEEVQDLINQLIELYSKMK